MSLIPLLAIVGPTASGKTALSLEICKQIGGEVVSADSMQIYKGISVASAAPTKAEMQGIKHHLIEFLNPEDSFSVSDYVLAAKQKIEEINNRGKRAVLVGGTGLYVDSLTNGITFQNSGKCNAELRSELTTKLNTVGAKAMLCELSQIDPLTAARLHENDHKRIIRAFEVYLSTGLTVTQQNELSKKTPSPYKTVFVGVNYKNRQTLYKRINTRVESMVASGLIEEAKATLNLNKGGGALQAIGHKELYPYINGEISLDEAVENLKRSTRRYAKRQITWFGKNPQIHWIYMDECENPVSAVMDILKGENYFEAY